MGNIKLNYISKDHHFFHLDYNTPNGTKNAQNRMKIMHNLKIHVHRINDNMKFYIQNVPKVNSR